MFMICCKRLKLTLFLCLQAGDAFDTVVEQIEECNEDFTDAKNKAKRATKDFEDIKQKRGESFNTAFQHIAKSLTTIYKDMTKSSKHPLGGNAYLSLDDTDEPYNGRIKFTAMPPMKRYRDMVCFTYRSVEMILLVSVKGYVCCLFPAMACWGTGDRFHFCGKKNNPRVSAYRFLWRARNINLARINLGFGAKEK